MKFENLKIWKFENGATRKVLRIFFLCLSLSIINYQLSIAQNVVPKPGERIFVKGGIAEIAVENKARVNLAEMTPDSLYRYMSAIDSLRKDGVRFDRSLTDSLVTSLIDRTSPTGDSLDEEDMALLVLRRKQLLLNSTTVRRFMDDRNFTLRYIDGGADTLIPKIVPPDTLTKREKRRLARRDTTAYRHSKIFRDSIKLSPMIAISMAVPGFSQLYNKQYWKIPVIYGALGLGMGLWGWHDDNIPRQRGVEVDVSVRVYPVGGLFNAPVGVGRPVVGVEI